MVCDLSKNNLKENLENYVNALLVDSYKNDPVFDYKKIVNTVYKDVYSKNKDENSALGIAYHVPQIIFEIIPFNKESLGLSNLMKKGYDPKALDDQIEKLKSADDKLLAIAKLLGKPTKSLDQIEEFVSNQPSDMSTIVLSVPDSDVTTITNVLASTPGFFATSQSGAEIDKNTGLPIASKTNEDAAFYQDVLTGILSAKNPEDNDFTKVTFGGHTGFKGKLMFERSIPGKLRADRESQLAYTILSFVLTDNSGNILYYNNDGTIGDINSGRPIYFLLKSTKKDTTKSSIKASMIAQLTKSGMTEEELKTAEKEITKTINDQVAFLEDARKKISMSQDVPVEITGGIKGVVSNPDNIVGEEARRKLTVPLSEFDIDLEEEKSIVFLVDKIGDVSANVPAIKFKNCDNYTTLKNPNKIGDKKEDEAILDNIVNIFTQNIKAGDEIISANDKVANVAQYIPLSQKGRKDAANYTIGINSIGNIEINMEGETLDLSDPKTAKETLKNFLAKNATIHFHKTSYDKNKYTAFELRPIEGGFNVSKVDKAYFDFIKTRLYPRVVRDERTKKAMVLNGYLSFKPITTIKETEAKVEEVTKEVEKEKVPVTKQKNEELYDDLLRSKFLNSISTPEQDTKAKTWWENSTLSTAKDSTGKPLFSLNLLRSVVNSEAFASFRDSVITLYKGADYTHVYHEAWHAFSQNYLTYSDRTSLYNAVSKLDGTFKVTKKIGTSAGSEIKVVDIPFSEASRLELEEFIAEEFRTYAMNDGKFKTKDAKSNILSKIFDRIWKALKALVGSSTSTNVYSNPGSEGVLSEMFNALYTAKTQEDLLPYSNNIKNAEFGLLNAGVVNAKHAEDNLTLSESLLLTRSIDGIISKITTDNVQGGKYSAVSLMFKSPKVIKDVYERALSQLNDKREEYLKELEALPKDKIVEKTILNNKISILTRATKPYMYGRITDILEGRDTNGSVIAFHRENSAFKDMFIEFKMDKDEVIDLEEEELEENLLGRNFEQKSVESEKLANNLTLYLIKSLLKQDKNGNFITNELGFVEPIDFKPFWRVMMDKVSGETSIMGLYNKIKNAGETVSPVFKQLLDKIFAVKKTEDVDGKSVNISTEESMANFLVEGSTTGDMWMKLVQSFNLHRIDLVTTTITQTSDGVELKVGKSTAEYQNIVKNWQSNFQQQKVNRHLKKNADGVNYLDVASIVEDYVNVNYNKAGDPLISISEKDYIPFLNSIGISLSDNTNIKELLIPDDVKYLAESIVKLNDYKKEIEDDYVGFERSQKLKDLTLLLSNPIELFRSGKKLPNGVSIINSAGNVNSLAQLEANYSEEYASGMRLIPDGGKKSVFALNSTDTQKIKALKKALNKGDLFSDDAEFMHMNFLNPLNNPASNGSVYLKSLFDPSGRKNNNNINIFDLSGSQFIVDSSDEGSSIGVSYAKMNFTDKFISDFVATLAGGFMQGIVPGDKSSYFSLKLDNIDTYSTKKTKYLFVDTDAFLKNKDGVNVAGYDGLSKTIEILYPKLEGEIRRIAMIKADPDYSSKVKGLENGDKFDLFFEMLDSKENLKDTLSSKEFFEAFNNSEMPLMDYLNLPENLELKRKIDSNIRSYFEKLVKEYDKNLFEKTFGNIKGLPKSLNNSLSDIILKDLTADQKALLGDDYSSALKEAAMMSYTVNNFLHKSETTLILQGDGIQFDHTKDDMTKRTPGSQSGGRVFAVDKLTQHWVNNKVGRPLEEKLLKDGSIKKRTEERTYDGKYNTAIIKESKVGSEYFNMYRDLFKKDFESKGLKGDALNIALYGKDNKTGKIGTGVKKSDGTYDTYDGGKLNPFSEIKDGDGQGWISFDSYRILKKVEGMWSEAQESAYKKIVNEELLSADELSDLFPVYKLQYNGPLATPTGKYPVQAFHKFSLFPLIPSVIKGKPAEKMHNAMMEQNIDYALFESGSKRSFIKGSAESKGDNIYEGDTSKIKAKEDVTFTPNPIYLTYLKNQTDVNSFFKDYSTFSSQLRKLLAAGLYENGKPLNDKVDTLVKNFAKSIDRLVSYERKSLLEDLGWDESDVLKANVDSEKLNKMFNFLIKQLKKQGFSDHELSIMQADSNFDKIDISLSPLASRFEKLILSIVNRRLVKLNLKGEPYVELSSAFMQSTFKPTEVQYEDFGTNGLKSYVVDLSGKNNTKGFSFKRALTEMDQNLFKTRYFEKDSSGNYVPAVDDKNQPVNIAVYKTSKDANNKNIYTLDFDKSFERLNEMLKVEAWKLDDNNYKKIRLTGVRIPVQGDNSMEFGEVAEFLNPTAGPVIVIPAEIVAKSGTDFDVDKMTCYLPYITRMGTLLEDNLSEEELDKKISKLKEKVNAFKKTKEAIDIFKTEQSAKWMDIGPAFNKFRKAILIAANTVSISPAQLKALTSKNKQILETLELPGMEVYLKEVFPKAYNIYTKEIKGATIEDIKNVENGLSELLQQKSELSTAFKELSDAQEHKNNYISAIQNRLIDDIVNILQLPEKAVSLLSPNDTNIAKPVADTMKDYIQKADNETNFAVSLMTGEKVAKGINPGTVYREDYNNKKQQENIVSKGSLGIAAVDNYINILLNQAGAKMKPSMNKFGYVWSDKKGEFIKTADKPIQIDLKLKHNKLDGSISLSHVIDSNNKHSIAEVISQLMNGFVDAGKDAWVAYIQGNLDVVPKILFMLEAGVPYEDVAAFVNNPITRAYVSEKNKQKSAFSKLIYGYNHIPGDAKKETRINFLSQIGSDIKFTPETYANLVGITDLEGNTEYTGNIHGFYEGLNEIYEPEYFTNKNLNKIASSSISLKNKEQVAGFLQYLYIEDLISDYDNMKKAFNPDTKTTGDLFSAEAKIEEVASIADAKSLDYNVYNFIKNKSVIAPFFVQSFARNLFGRLFKLRDNSKVNAFLLSKVKNFKDMAEIKKVTAYDTEGYIIKFKNFLAQYVFANELRQYNPMSKSYKGIAISQEFLDKVNKDFDEKNYIIGSQNPDSYINRKLAPINPAAFDTNASNNTGESFMQADKRVRKDFIEFVLEREFLRRTTPMNSLLNTKEFELRKSRLISSNLGMYKQLTTDSKEEYTNRINKMTYEDYLANQALKNTYNIWQIFRSGDNTIARELMDIINNYPEIGDNIQYSILQQFTIQGINNKPALKNVTNFMLKNYSNLDEGLINEYNNQWKNLADTGKFKIVGNNEEATKANAYISNFFAKLPIYAFLQSGMDSSQFSLTAVMPYENYMGIMEKASTDFINKLEKEDSSKILSGINGLFMAEHSASRDKKPLRNRGLLVKQPTSNLPLTEYSLYEQPFIKEVEPGLFHMAINFEMNGRKAVVPETRINALRNANKDTIFITGPSDILKFVNNVITPQEAIEAETNIDILVDQLKPTGKRIVVNIQAFQKPGAEQTESDKNNILNEPAINKTKLLTDGEVAAFILEMDKNNKLPDVFYTNDGMNKWVLNSNNLYHLVDKTTGEVYLKDVDLKTGYDQSKPKVQPSTNMNQPTTFIEETVRKTADNMIKQINLNIKENGLDVILAEKGYDVKDIISNLEAVKTVEDLNKINKILDKLC